MIDTVGNIVSEIHTSSSALQIYSSSLDCTRPIVLGTQRIFRIKNDVLVVVVEISNYRLRKYLPHQRPKLSPAMHICIFCNISTVYQFLCFPIFFFFFLAATTDRLLFVHTVRRILQFHEMRHGPTLDYERNELKSLLINFLA